MAVENRRNRVRAVAAAVLTLLLLVPLGVLWNTAWGRTVDDRATTTREQQGVSYLAELGPLASALAATQSAALSGVDGAPAELNAAVAAVAAVDGRLGETLRTRQRWTELRTKIEQLPTAARSAAVYQAHAQVADLLLALCTTVSDNSRLARDPDNDLAHLQQAVSTDLPLAVVQGSRMADLSVLAGQVPADQQARLRSDFATAVASVQIAVDRLTTNLEAAVDDTSSRTLSGDLIGTLDTFRRGMETLTRGANPGGKPDSATLATARGQLEQILAGIDGTIVKEMDGLLDQRLDDLGADRQQLLIIAGVAVLLALLAIVVPLLGRRRGSDRAFDAARADTGSAGGRAGGPPGAVPLFDASSSRREPSGATR